MIVIEIEINSLNKRTDIENFYTVYIIILNLQNINKLRRHWGDFIEGNFYNFQSFFRFKFSYFILILVDVYFFVPYTTIINSQYELFEMFMILETQ